LDSHVISQAAEQALKSSAIDIFLSRRGDDLQKIVDHFLSNRLEVDAILRPPLDDLLVAGSEEG
jgi:hypothetical protein